MLAKDLFPQARRVAFLDVAGRVEWSSDAAPMPESWDLASFARRVRPADRGPFTLPAADGGLAAFLPVAARGRSSALLGVWVDAQPPRTEAQMLREMASAAAPLLDCLCRELDSGSRKPPKAATLSQRTDELEWLFGLTETLHSKSNDPRSLQWLLGAAVERLKCCFGAVMIPAHGVNVRHESLVHIDLQAANVLDRMNPFLLGHAQRCRQPLLVNRPPNTPGIAPFKSLCVPVAPQEAVIGYVAFLRSGSGKNFASRHAFLAQHVGHQIGVLLESPYDPTTGLLTRHAFEQDVRHALATSTDQTHALVAFGLDRFHLINDTMGMTLGDEAIVRVADLLRPPALPEDAIAGRWGADGFIVFLPHQGIEQTWLRAEQIMGAVRETSVGSDDDRMALSLSFGVAPLNSAQTSLEGALSAADSACRKARADGGNRGEISLRAERRQSRAGIPADAAAERASLPLQAWNARRGHALRRM